MTQRFVCIHGHFYQPPRENPWLEAVELQDSAYPYHDWNERITDECYATNAASRILDASGRIVRIANNYRKISFNFGPTLLDWMMSNAPDTYDAVLRADRESREKFSGHGSAMAQAYNHMILPLANRADKRTQLLWGLHDFRFRFGREPEGLWLPETAVDLESLELMAEMGIRFTVLAPHQARRIRPLDGGPWQDVAGARIDPTRAYLQRLPSGREIALFFYDGPISRAVAFEDLLRNGERFAARLASAFSDQRTWPQLAHIATDGETYGHHHRHGDMALAYALRQLDRSEHVRLTNYGEFLEIVPPTHEVEIVENTAWSCAHGVERWRSNCGCNTGMHPGWSQEWRAPLRAALDWLRDALAPKFEEAGTRVFRDPWAARDDYARVILDRSTENVDRFLEEHAGRALDPAETATALKLLELQRHAQLMYTSCGWFFDDVSGIETVQIVQYAGRAIQLAQELFGNGIEAGFLERLADARSNLPAQGDGRDIYESAVRPAMVDLRKVGAHFAINSLFEPSADQARVYCYRVDVEHFHQLRAGKARLAAGRARVTSEITREVEPLSFGVLHFGDHNVSGGVRTFRSDEAFDTLLDEVADPFARADFPAVLRALDQHFHGSTYSLKSLFRNEQRRILDRILESALTEAESTYRRMYEHNAPLMQFLNDLRIPLPNAFAMAAEFVLNTSLVRALGDEELDLDRIRGLLDEARRSEVALDAAGLGFALEGTLEALMHRLARDPDDLPRLRRIEAVIALVETLPFEVNLWKVQNVYYDMVRTAYPAYRDDAEAGREPAREWVEHFVALGEALTVHVA